MAGTTIDYVGSELELFSGAVNWKAYMGRSLRPYIQGSVGEVGAGIGATTTALCGRPATAWTCVEPDRAQHDKLVDALRDHACDHPVSFHAGTLADLPRQPLFDTILYIDVLEHIAEDKAEIKIAFDRLKPGGRIVVLCPAWQFLFSPFDASIGHHRRYTKTTLRAVACEGMSEIAAFYLDSVGFLASLCNKALLRQSMPSQAQIKLWDSAMVPVSTILDSFLFHSIGKSVVVIWQKRD